MPTGMYFGMADKTNFGVNHGAWEFAGRRNKKSKLKQTRKIGEGRKHKHHRFQQQLVLFKYDIS